LTQAPWYETLKYANEVNYGGKQQKRKNGIMVRGTYGGRFWSPCVPEFLYILAYNKNRLWSDREIIIYSFQYSD